MIKSKISYKLIHTYVVYVPSLHFSSKQEAFLNQAHYCHFQQNGWRNPPDFSSVVFPRLSVKYSNFYLVYMIESLYYCFLIFYVTTVYFYITFLRNVRNISLKRHNGTCHPNFVFLNLISYVAVPVSFVQNVISNSYKEDS